VSFKLSLFILSFSTALFAADYTYVSFFENNIPRTAKELLALQNKNSSFLTRFNCSQFKDQLFAHELSVNPNKDSLRIITTKGKILIFNKDLESKDKFAEKVIKALKELSLSQVGRTLIDKLMTSPYGLWIKSGGNRFDPRGYSQKPMYGLNEAGALSTFVTKRLQVDRMEFKTWGSGGFVLWNSVKKFDAMESDGKIRPTPTYIALGHELYHAYDSTRGFLDRRMIKGEGFEFQPVIEYRAVYFENLLRKEGGRLYRKYYSAPSKSVQGTMLDSNGNPIFIPTDCYSRH
jgi:hypothetical protein